MINIIINLRPQDELSFVLCVQVPLDSTHFTSFTRRHQNVFSPDLSHLLPVLIRSTPAKAIIENWVAFDTEFQNKILESVSAPTRSLKWKRSNLCTLLMSFMISVLTQVRASRPSEGYILGNSVIAITRSDGSKRLFKL